MAYSDDPERDFDRWDAERESWLRSLPKCSECKQPIQDDTYYRFDEKRICNKCLEEKHRRFTDDYPED